MLQLIFLAVFFGVLMYGPRFRHRRGHIVDRAFTSKLATASFSMATAVTGVVIPALWLFVSFSSRGGSVEDNLPPGFSVSFILGILLIGTVAVAIGAAYGYIEHLLS